MLEPEFFLLFVVSGIAGAVPATLGAGLFFVGWFKKSKLLKIIGACSIGLGIVVFSPIALLMIMWLCYWVSA